MMRSMYYDMTIGGKPILAPDGGIAISASDLDANDSGRDESGVMHRFVLRERVKTWELSYSVLTAQEYQYMLDLFRGKATFQLEYMEPSGKKATCVAYCSKHGIEFYDARLGLYKNMKFSIIEC